MIENTLIFVIDSLRWDALPERLAEKGVIFKTVAQGLFTPPSFTSLSTGQYPPEHGVFDFTDQVSESVPTIYDLLDISGGFYAPADPGENGIYSVLGVDKTTLEEQTPPFVQMERDPEPHLPFAGAESVEAYYRTRRDDWDTVRAEYEDAIVTGVEKFERRVQYLKENDLLDSTLIVVTSDHGELFGEYGCVGHSAPATPELAYVPTVFIHPSLSAESFQVDPEREVIEHVDIVETALSSIGVSDFETSGTDVLSTPRERPWGYNHVERQRRGRHFYTANSMWWYDGGYSFVDNPRLYRALFGLFQLARDSTRFASRRDPIALMRTYLGSSRRFNSPLIPQREAERALTMFTETLTEADSKASDLNSATKERLERLGYLDT